MQKSSTYLLGILFLLAVVALLLGPFFSSLLDPLAAYLGEKKAGQAIIPAQVKEKWAEEGRGPDGRWPDHPEIPPGMPHPQAKNSDRD